MDSFKSRIRRRIRRVLVLLILNTLTPFPPQVLVRLMPVLARGLPRRRLKPEVIRAIGLTPFQVDDWSRKMRQGSLLNRLPAHWLHHRYGERKVQMYLDLLDTRAVEDASCHGKGVLIVGAHLGAAEMAAYCLRRHFDVRVISANVWVVANNASDRKRFEQDIPAALRADFLMAYMRLRDGGTVYATADVATGAQIPLPLLGVQVPFSTGIPNLIQRTGCEVFFIAVKWMNDRLVPVLEPCPITANFGGEDYDTQWLSHYIRWMESHLKSDPLCFRRRAGMMGCLYEAT